MESVTLALSVEAVSIAVAVLQAGLLLTVAASPLQLTETDAVIALPFVQARESAFFLLAELSFEAFTALTLHSRVADSVAVAVILTLLLGAVFPEKGRLAYTHPIFAFSLMRAIIKTDF